MNGDVQRVDIMFDNTEGVFCQIAEKIGKRCPYLPFECKNYANDLANPEYDQLCGRLNSDVGAIGILVCRSITNRDRVREHCQTRWRNEQVVLVLTDADLAKMFWYRFDGAQELVDKVILDRFRSLMLNVRPN